ncbi:MAG: bifunctional folylpolyglutamate synthase/dihydrofolate synthase [Opitutales bacterium]|nr:bifunctional folylpolyglutamate synthase/dihydrofolate synthase [Opitutales bacterium]
MSSLADYAEVKAYLYGLKHRGANYGIERMQRMVDALGVPTGRHPIIHVAGTNGKGSTCALLEAIYRRAGQRTGLFTSPHLVFQGERVQVDRVPLSQQQVMDFTRKLRPIAETIETREPGYHPTFFEFMTSMALLRFEEAAVDVAMLETGLGGRLDATNVVDPAISIITSISLDHVDILGDTIEAIAAEKAGIIKAGKPLVIGHLPPAAEAVIRRIAAERGSVVHSIHERFGPNLDSMPETALPGDYQRFNAAAATLAAEVLRERLPVSDAQIHEALLDVSWSGRWETHAVGSKQLILDASHNPEGAVFLEANLKRLIAQTGVRPVILAGTLGNHRAQSLMPIVARYAREIYLLRPNQPRACSEEELLTWIPPEFEGRIIKAKIRELFPAPGECVVGEAGETVVATGSIYLIGEIMEALYHEVPVGEETLQD